MTIMELLLSPLHARPYRVDYILFVFPALGHRTCESLDFDGLRSYRK